MESEPLLTNKDYRFSAALFARAVGCVGSVAEGYDIGCLGAIVAAIKRDLGLTAKEVGLLASVPTVFFAVAAIGGGWLADRWGRKGCILLTCFSLLVGVCFQVMAGHLWSLIIGRSIVNAAAGSGVVVVSTYLTEVTPARHRGVFVSVEELCLNFGIAASYFATWCLAERPRSWRLVIGLGAVGPAAAFLLCLLPQVLESPRYLFLRGRGREAELALRRLVREPREVEQAIAAWEAEAQAPAAAAWRLPRAALLASVGLAACASLAGVLAVNSLLSYVLLAAGGGQASAVRMALAIMVAKFLVLVPVCFYFIDRVGRRPLLVASSLFMALGCGTTAAALAGCLPRACAFVGIGIHLTCYSMGVGPVMWTYCTEVIPTRMRGPGMGLAVLIGRSLATVQLFLLPVVLELSLTAPFLFYTGTNLCTIVFVMYVCPETKCISLEGLHSLFKE